MWPPVASLALAVYALANVLCASPPPSLPSASASRPCLAAVDLERDLPSFVHVDRENVHLTQAKAHAGRSSLAISSGRDGKFSGLAPIVVEVPIDERTGPAIRASAWLRTEGMKPDAGGAEAYVRLVKGDRVLYVRKWSDVIRNALVAEDDWARVQLTIANSGRADKIQFAFYGGGFGKAVYVDDICVEAIAKEDVGGSDEARRYFDDALTYIRGHAMRRASVDWAQLDPVLEAQVRRARTPSETWPAIQYALAALQDGHSMFIAPTNAAKNHGASTEASIRVEVVDGFARIVVPSYPGPVDASAEAFARHGSRSIEAAARNTCGWIVDLRTDGGGNMWPMLAALAPLLAEETVGYFVADGHWQPWRIQARELTIAGKRVIGRPAFHASIAPLVRAAPVAVLVGPGTLSSGEAIALAFRGRPNTRLIGAATGGVNTANDVKQLPDGAIIALSVAEMADRIRRIARGPIEPDVSAADPERAALDFLRTASECR